MPLKYNNTQPTEIKYNGTSLTDVKYGSTVVWRKRTVTYYSETGTTRTATYIEGQAISLSANYAVAKSGYSFVGWRQDRSASSSVISSLTMGSSNVSLYAVYQKSITVTYYNNSTSATSTSGYQYYNTGNVTNPSFKLTQSSRSGWNARGWSTNTAANGSISYNNGASFTRDSNITLRGMYQKTVTLSYNGNGATGGSTASQSGTAYYNSGSNSTINPSFTVRSNGFTRTNYKFVNWRLNSTSGTAYNAGASITLSSNSTMYASWETSWVTSTVKYDGSGWRVSGDGNLMFGSTSSSDNKADVVTTRTCTGNIVKFTDSSRYFRITANTNCTVSISYNVTIQVLDGWTWYPYRNDYAINGGSMVSIFNWGNYGGNGQQPSNINPNGTKSVNLNAGQTLAFYASGGTNNSRSWFRWIYTLTCTKR